MVYTPQLGPLLLRRPRGRDGRSTRASGWAVRGSSPPACACSTCRGCRRCSPGAAHRRAVVDGAELPRAADSRRAPCRRRRAVRRARRRAAAGLVATSAARGPSGVLALSLVGVDGRCSRGSRRRSRPRGRRATSPSCSGRCCCSPPRRSCAAGGSASSRSSPSSSSGGLQRARTTRRTHGRSPPGSRRSSTRASSSSRPTRSRCRCSATTSAPACAGRRRSGRSPDPQVFDWRDAVDRLDAAEPKPTLDAVVASVPPGRSSSSSRPSSATTGPGRHVDAARLATVGRVDVAPPARPALRGRAARRRPTRSRSSATTSSRCRRLCIAESARVGVGSGCGRPTNDDGESPDDARSRRRPGRADRRLPARARPAATSSCSRPTTRSAASRRRSRSTATASTSAATGSSRSRSRSTRSGTRSSARSSCCGRGCRASTGTTATSTTRCAAPT